MHSSRIVLSIAAAAFVTTGAFAQMAPAKPAAKTMTTKTMTTTQKSGSMATVKTAAATTTKTPAAGGKMAVHTTATGKKITYDCSKAGNKNKTACKKG